MATLGIWLAVFSTLAIYSFLYGDNPFYRFAEHAFVGLAAAHTFVMGFEAIVQRAWNPMLKGQWWWLGAIIGGFMILCRWFKPVNWISRLPVGFMMGVAAALSARRAVQTEFWNQVTSTTAMSLRLKSGAVNYNAVLYIVIVVTTLVYFLFVYNDKSRYGVVLRRIGAFGQLAMMVAFGASLGSTIMARLSLVIARLDFLFRTWLHILK